MNKLYTPSHFDQQALDAHIKETVRNEIKSLFAGTPTGPTKTSNPTGARRGRPAGSKNVKKTATKATAAPATAHPTVVTAAKVETPNSSVNAMQARIEKLVGFLKTQTEGVGAKAIQTTLGLTAGEWNGLIGKAKDHKIVKMTGEKRSAVYSLTPKALNGHANGAAASAN